MSEYDLIDITDRYADMENPNTRIFSLVQSVKRGPIDDERDYLLINTEEDKLWVYMENWLQRGETIIPGESPVVCLSREKVKELIYALQEWVEENE